MSEFPARGERILMVTGRLAAPALRRMSAGLERDFGVSIVIEVLPITVAALMSPLWIARHLQGRIPPDCSRVVIPGYCDGDLAPLTEMTSVPVVVGPRDLRRLPELFGASSDPVPLDEWSIEIIAEINAAPRQSIDALIAMAEKFRSDGADVIDVGCLPGETWSEVGTAVRELAARGFRVSIDSLQPEEIAAAVDAGAELVLSVNSSNRRAAADWGCEVVVIPDSTDDWLLMGDTIEYLATRSVPLRIDPVLEPIGCGFAASLGRYLQARSIWPDAPMMMGIGNLTELTDVDSAGVNFLLLAICEELAIGSVLTTEVINWARTSVRECDIARRLVHAAWRNQIPPKNLDERLVCLRDARLVEFSAAELQELATQIRDRNYRIAVSGDRLHLLGGGLYETGNDPFALFDALLAAHGDSMDASHAFYLGYELCKAAIAQQLGKQYEQDEALRWGHLTIDEPARHRLQRRRKR